MSTVLQRIARGMFPQEPGERPGALAWGKDDADWRRSPLDGNGHSSASPDPFRQFAPRADFEDTLPSLMSFPHELTRFEELERAA